MTQKPETDSKEPDVAYESGGVRYEVRIAGVRTTRAPHYEQDLSLAVAHAAILHRSFSFQEANAPLVALLWTHRVCLVLMSSVHDQLTMQVQIPDDMPGEEVALLTTEVRLTFGSARK